MRTVALISGGKDGSYNMVQCVSEGHDVVALANLKPVDKDELDSYMYQTVGHQAIDLYAEAMELPLYRATIKGTSKSIGHIYQPTKDDEVEDLYSLLKEVKEKESIEAVSVGAILSDYQRVRVENVCERLGLTSLSYLWRRDQKELLKEMIDSGVIAVVIKVATLGLEPDKHLQKTLGELYPHLLKMNELYQINVCGEGGEYETFTLDCPLFNKKIVLDEVEQIIHSADFFAPVGYLNLKAAHLEKKDIDVSLSWKERLKDLPLKRSCDLNVELFREEVLLSPVCQQVDVKCAPTNTDTIRFSLRISQNNLWISGLHVSTQPGLSITESTQKMMERLKDGMEGLGNGHSLKQLVLVCLYVQNMDDFAAVNSIYRKYFGVNPPARVCVEASLPQNVCLQMDCFGYTGEAGRHTMHVQGISHWAPANIGPYSQSVKLNNTVYVAGQIALCPASMKVVEGGIVQESCLSLRHVERVCVAMSPDCGLSCVVSVVCYVTNRVYIKTAANEWSRKREKYVIGSNFGEEKQTTPCVETYVVIPRLPRDALVEWQVYASMAGDIQDGEEKLSSCSYEVVLKYCYSLSADKTFSCAATVDTLNNDTGPPYDRAVQLFLRGYETVLHKIGRIWSDVPLIRIFFSCTWCDYANLLQAFKTCFTEKMETPILSLVPVCELATSMTVMSICH